MKIYFAGSIKGGRENQKIYEIIVKFLESHGHKVLTKHVARPDVVELESRKSKEAIFSRDLKWLHEADILIADVSIPSLGVGWEIAYFSRVLRKPVVCLTKKPDISAMIAGDPRIPVYEYDDENLEDVLEMIEKKYLIKDKNQRTKR